jgi:hypothetical protein
MIEHEQNATSYEQPGCVVCGKPGVVVQRVWPLGPEGSPGWLCQEHRVPKPPEKAYVDRGGYCDVCGGWHKGECSRG